MKNRVILLAILLFSFTGCTQFMGYTPNSHVAYPNSNVTPIGPARATSAASCSWTPQFVTADIQEQAIHEAIRSRNGDTLIDYANFSTTWFIPLLYVNIYCMKYTVEGTVAKQEIGFQKLK